MSVVERVTRILLPATLLLLFILQTFATIRDKSATSDEFSHHIASGYSYLLTGDFRLNSSMPPLPKLLSAVPLWFLGAKAPFESQAWKDGDTPGFAKEFFYRSNPGRLDEFVFWARVPIALIGLLFGLSVFLVSRKLFGFWAGVTSLCLFSFCPDVIAHSALATSDICVSFFFFLALAALAGYLERPSPQWLILMSLATALAFLSKPTAVLLPPLFILIALVSKKMKLISLRAFSIFAGIFFVTVWLGYFFEMKPLLTNTPSPEKKIEWIRQTVGPTAVLWAKEISLPLTSFASGIASLLLTRVKGTNAFLMGEWSTQGWWYYYFVAFFIKNTLPFLILSVLSILGIQKLSAGRTVKATLLVPVIFFFGLATMDKAQAGIRYFLPVYPLLFVLCGGWAAASWRRPSPVYKLFLPVALAWHAWAALAVCPNALAYFNESIGGSRNGYRYLRDSNIDWGQDLKNLAKKAKDKEYPEIALSYSGPVDPDYYQILHRPLTERELIEPDRAVYAISVHSIEHVKWTKTVKPDDVVGYSIFIYDFRHQN